MKVNKLIVGESATNCYIVEKDDSCVVIDPGDDSDYISEFLTRKNCTPLGILLTHAHFDHLGAAIDLKLNFNIPIYLNAKDDFLLKRARKTARHFSNLSFPDFKEDMNLSEGEVVFAGFSIKTIFTPGHTPGSTCFLIDNNLFSGDLIFADGSFGEMRSYSERQDLKKSIARVFKLKEETYFWPGHGDGIFLYELKKIFKA